MNKQYLLLIVFCISANAALPPPQGTTVQSENQYSFDEKPLSWYDITGRVDNRSRLKQEFERSESLKQSELLKSKQNKQLSNRKKLVSSDSIKTSKSSTEIDSTNLPSYYQGIDRSSFKASDKVMYVPQNAIVKLGSVRSGDIFHAVVEQRIKASPGVPTPIRAMVTSGGLKGGFFIGEATLDRELKRILFVFNKVRSSSGKAYNVRAAGLSPQGSIGLEGEYHSQAGSFFVAELASATAAGMLDSTIARNQNVLGNYVQEPSLSNSAKTGAVTALSRTTDRMAENVRQAPEFTEIEGYQPIQIIVQDDPTELN